MMGDKDYRVTINSALDALTRETKIQIADVNDKIGRAHV